MNRLLCGALAVAAVGLSFSCSKEEIKNSGYDPGVAEYDQTRYLKVVLANPEAGTKADQSFDAGKTEENAIKDIRFVFYDKDGNLTSNTVTVSGDQITPEPGTPENGSVNSVVELSLPVDIMQGENMPAYVMCYVNSFRPGEVGYKTITELSNVRRTKVVGDGTEDNISGTFPMNNSSYYGSDPIKGQTGVRILATPIPAGAFGATEKEASSITIYVERYAAKVQLKMPEASKIHAFEIDGKKLIFTPSGWAVNAVDTDMFLVKRFGNAENEPLEDINGRIGDWWNDEQNHRSYWACSPGYYVDQYPEVSDDITDTPEMAKNKYCSEYLKYSEIVSPNNAMTNNIRYVREATVNSEMYKSAPNSPAVRNPKATLPSVIIAGKYQIEGENADQDFFIYGGKVYTSRQDMLSYMVNNAQRIVYAENGYYVTENDFVLEHPEQEVRGDIKVPGRYVTLQLKNPVGNFLKDGEYIAVSEGNLNEVNRLLMTSVGYAESYIKGMAYFAVPIKHLGWYWDKENNDNWGKSISDKTWDWTKVRTGDFGIVRNHVYNVEISEIKGRATGLYSKDQPLVPPTDISSYDVKYEVKTLNWAVVPTQTETL